MMLSVIGCYNFDPEIFDDMNVPEGVSKQTVIDSILLECGELEVLYPSVPVMKLAIGVWSDAEQQIWEKLQNTVDLDYNPLWNVDASITETREGSGSEDGDDTHNVKGYNATNWANSDQIVRDAERSWEETNTISRTGNIGVTSSQQLIQQEREVAEFSLIKYITDSFKRRFCLLVY